MMGQQPKQDNTWDDRAKATHVLVDTLNRHELGLSYLVALARDRYHDRLSGYGSDVMIDAIRTKLTSREIMQLVYTINNRGRAKTTQFSNNLGLTDPITEPYADPSIMPPGTLANRYNATPTTPPDHDPS